MAMRGVNLVCVAGNVGADPEVKYMPSGIAVVNFSIATSEVWEKDGNKGEHTEWHRITAFAKLAEIIGEYVHKGDKLYIRGHLKTRSWEQDGVTRYATDIIADELQFMGSKSADASSGRSGPHSGSTTNRSGLSHGDGDRRDAKSPIDPELEGFDDDIPF